jgi:hypothetical protein
LQGICNAIRLIALGSKQYRAQNQAVLDRARPLAILLANSKMSDKLQFVEAFGSGRTAETSDKLKFVGHFQRHFALLPSLPAVSLASARYTLSILTSLTSGKLWCGKGERAGSGS